MVLNPVIFGQNRNPIVGGSLDPVVTDWVARTIAAGGSVANSTQTAIDNFVKGCKTDGIWSVMQSGLILPLASDGFNGFAVPLIGPNGLILTNNNFVSADYSLNTGLNPGLNNSTRWIDTNINFGALGASSNSIQGSIYTRNIAANNVKQVAISAINTDAVQDAVFTPYYTANAVARAYGSNIIVRSNVPTAETIALTSFIRNSATFLGFFSRGIVRQSIGNPNGTLPTANITLLNRPFDSGSHYKSIVSYFYLGRALTTSQESLHYNRVQALQTALDRAV